MNEYNFQYSKYEPQISPNNLKNINPILNSAMTINTSFEYDLSGNFIPKNDKNTPAVKNISGENYNFLDNSHLKTVESNQNPIKDNIGALRISEFSDFNTPRIPFDFMSKFLPQQEIKKTEPQRDAITTSSKETNNYSNIIFSDTKQSDLPTDNLKKKGEFMTESPIKESKYLCLDLKETNEFLTARISPTKSPSPSRLSSSSLKKSFVNSPLKSSIHEMYEKVINISVENSSIIQASIVVEKALPKIDAAEQYLNTKNIKINNENLYQNSTKKLFKDLEGSFYTGDTVEGKKHGFGKLKFANGGTYEGNWVDNAMEGFGCLYFSNEKLAYMGTFEKDKFEGEGEIYNEYPEVDPNFNPKDLNTITNNWINYKGFFKDDRKSGVGTLSLLDDFKYYGLFLYDKPHGKGKLYKNGKILLAGTWRHGVFTDTIQEMIK